jgi:hypothetical protein
VAYELVKGPIPEGLYIDHMCHTPACVNPDHLRAVTNKQNAENHNGQPCSANTSGIRGVYWHIRDKRWVARVRHNGKFISVGSFLTAEEAESAVIAKRNELFTHNDADRMAVRGEG